MWNIFARRLSAAMAERNELFMRWTTCPLKYILQKHSAWLENPDVAKAVGELKKQGQILVGFAAETEHLADYAREKLVKKNLDMIVANDVTREGAGFNTDTNIATLITAGSATELPIMTKRELADRILDEIRKTGEGSQSAAD